MGALIFDINHIKNEWMVAKQLKFGQYEAGSYLYYRMPIF